MEKAEDGETEVLRNTELLEIHGSEADGVDHVTLAENAEGYPSEKLDDPDTRTYDMDVGAVFLAIGHTPNTDYLADTGVELDDEGYLITQGGRGGNQTATGVEGVFGAGDVVDFHYQQAATAGGMGVQAALDADDYLDELDRARKGAASEEESAEEEPTEAATTTDD
jgi:thioredoxin reductase (NADPH)